MNKLEAIRYLQKHSEYENEWTGAGMWEAVEAVLTTKKKISKKMLDKLLEVAEDF